GSSVMGTMVSNPAMMAWRGYLASVRSAQGDRAAARKLVLEEVELARKFGAPRPIGMSLRVAGLVEGGAKGIALLEESVATLRRSPAKLELTRSLVDLGAEVRRQGSRSAAREHLREGLEAARSQGAVALEARATDELAATGGRPRRRSNEGLGALTPGERRVAELAASGMTNREIAQTLFVTVKAVQFHLRNIYSKLEIGSREELGVALRGGS
ncbi:MAG: LuxR C-terminal-related transcriptional regulator, partial [Actinomycetota bacterium]|nr:LuxR C-terminal-related transcriptional regulator [Actinomycetota bacterium]